MIIYALSDATGELAINVATSALRQFGQYDIPVLRRAKIQTAEKVSKVVREAVENKGFIVFTLVSSSLRKHLLKAAGDAKVMAIDVMGPVMEAFSRYFRKTPSDQPGLRYQMNPEYIRRNEAIEFTVQHDDGMGLETLHEADIVLLGVSRTSKTPLSIYLAYHGFKTANVPIVLNVPLPWEVLSVAPQKIVGLTIAPETLMDLRTKRLQKLGRGLRDQYVDPDVIDEELQYSKNFFSSLPNCPVIAVTSKAIEEVASEILTVLNK